MMAVVFSFLVSLFFCFQAEDCIRGIGVTGVQTCALPIFAHSRESCSLACFSVLKHRSVSIARLRSLAIGRQVLATSSVGTSAAQAAAAARLVAAIAIVRIGKRIRLASPLRRNSTAQSPNGFSPVSG